MTWKNTNEEPLKAYELNDITALDGEKLKKVSTKLFDMIKVGQGNPLHSASFHPINIVLFLF